MPFAGPSSEDVDAAPESKGGVVAGPVVDIRPGAVRGMWRGKPGEPGSSAAFLGIPFAKPPVGDLRFEAPEPPDPWEGVRDAVTYGPTPLRGPQPEVTLIPEPSVPGESTLNVNVFTPRPSDTEAKLPVLVWIHGGGYIAGSPASPWYDGRTFNRDGIVTVSVSYRLGFDGFGHIDGAPANRGVRDWIAALEWVRDNIAAFGGDPSRVTIAGQSAGGGAVLTLLGLPAAQHLFHAAWSMSGALGDVSRKRAEERADKLARLANVAPTRAGFASVDEETLLALQSDAASPGSRNRLAAVNLLLDEGPSWGPMVDGELLKQPTPDSIRAGVGADKPLVLGATDDEFTMLLDRAKGSLRFVPASLALGRLKLDRATRRAYVAANAEQHRKGTSALLGRYVSDRAFRSTVVRVAAARKAAKSDAPTWVYRFTWTSPAIGWACHCLDVPFWFDCLDADRVDALAGTAPPQELADAVHGAAVRLIGGEDPGWTAWSERPGATRMFGAASGTEVDPDGYASVRPLVPPEPPGL